MPRRFQPPPRFGPSNEPHLLRQITAELQFQEIFGVPTLTFPVTVNSTSPRGPIVDPHYESIVDDEDLWTWKFLLIVEIAAKPPESTLLRNFCSATLAISWIHDEIMADLIRNYRKSLGVQSKLKGGLDVTSFPDNHRADQSSHFNATSDLPYYPGLLMGHLNPPFNFDCTPKSSKLQGRSQEGGRKTLS